jgi:hypothetical protein
VDLRKEYFEGEVTFPHLLRYSSSCVKYREFLDRVQLLTQKLPTQGYVATRLKSSLQKVYGCHHNTVDRYKIFISQMTMDLLLLCFLSFKKFIFRYQDLVEIYSVSAETIISDASSYSENV